MAHRLEARDEDLLSVLTTKVRVLALAQIARAWWPKAREAEAAAHRRLTALASEGLLDYAPLWARPELVFTAPLFTWQPGLPDPDVARLAAQTGSRWTLPAVSTPCAVATIAAGVRFGDRGGRSPREPEVTHDLHLARVYLLMRHDLPTRARSWRCEEVIAAGRAEQAEKLPDAIVTDGRHETAIEFAGAYPAAKLRDFHDYCVATRLAYELW